MQVTPSAPYLLGSDEAGDRHARASDRRQWNRPWTRLKHPWWRRAHRALVAQHGSRRGSALRPWYPLLSPPSLLAGSIGPVCSQTATTTAATCWQRTPLSPYFYYADQPCNKRRGPQRCGALEGFSRQTLHLVVKRHLIATHPVTMAIAMRALDAVVETVQPCPTRSIPIADFHTASRASPQIDTICAKWS